MPSPTHLVLIPSYNTGPRLDATLAQAVAQWDPVWVVIDGSTDGSGQAAAAFAREDSRVRVIFRTARGGKGAAVATGAAEACQAGFSHVLILDADGQHPADRIAEFMAASQARPEALVLGRPIFGPDAPTIRLRGRRLSIWITRVEILGSEIVDPLFGFRVYPLGALRRAFGSTAFGRGYDFDPEMAVRTFWLGAPVINLPAPCRYLSAQEGGVSHFRYLRDNLVLIWMNMRLLTELLCRQWPRLVRRRRGRTRLAVWMGFLLAAALPAPPAACASEPVIANPAADPAWRDLLPGLAGMGNRCCAFEERRVFPFRPAPVVLSGELRFSSDRGLSLQYFKPEERLIVIGRRGLLLQSDGQTETFPLDEPSLGPLAALFPVIEFDLKRLSQLFVLRGRRHGDFWTVQLAPRERALAHRLESVRISGEGSRLKTIRLDLGGGGRIEIDLGSIRTNVAFTPLELKRYFP